MVEIPIWLLVLLCIPTATFLFIIAYGIIWSQLERIASDKENEKIYGTKDKKDKK